MRKWFLVVIAIFSSSVVYSNYPEKIETLSTKIILQNEDGYFVFSDGSCWKAMGFSKRWRTLSEWWNNVQLTPERYECIPSDWYLGAQIEIYPKYGNLEISEADASNQDALKQCTHLLVNSRTGQVLFAIALHPSECLIHLFKEARKEGYEEGYAVGFWQNHRNHIGTYHSQLPPAEAGGL